MGHIHHNKVHGTYSKTRNISLVWLYRCQKKKNCTCKSSENDNVDSHATLPFGAVSILVARRASSRTKPRIATNLDIHTWRADFPASWTFTEAIHPCHRRLPVNDEAGCEKQASERYFHRGAINALVPASYCRLSVFQSTHMYASLFGVANGECLSKGRQLVWVMKRVTTLLYISWIGIYRSREVRGGTNRIWRTRDLEVRVPMVTSTAGRNHALFYIVEVNDVDFLLFARASSENLSFKLVVFVLWRCLNGWSGSCDGLLVLFFLFPIFSRTSCITIFVDTRDCHWDRIFVTFFDDIVPGRAVGEHEGWLPIGNAVPLVEFVEM